MGTSLRLVVAEAPGEMEALEGEPLVGGSGRRFDALCRCAGVRRDSLTLVNTIQCRPPANIYPTDPSARGYISASEAEAATTQCYQNHVLPLLKSRPWQRVDLLGDKALRRLSPQTSHDGVMNNRGFVVPIEALDNRLVGLPTLHPAYVARDQIYSKVVISDLSKGLQLAPEDYNPYPTLEDVQAFTATTLALDIENCPKTLAISMVGLSASPYKALCVPFRGAYVPELKRILGAAKVVIGQNSLQHDEPILKLAGVHINPEAEHYDTMLMSHLLLPDLKHGLEFLGSIFIQKQRWKNRKGESEEIYNCRDVDVTFQLWQQFLPMLRKERLLDLYLDVQVPLARICKMMQDQGVRVEPGRVVALREKFTEEVKRLDAVLPERLRSYLQPVKRRERAPEGTKSPKTGKILKFVSVDDVKQVSPWRSSEDLAAYFYDELHLPKQLHIKTKEVTTDKMALEKLGRKLLTKEFSLHPRLGEAISAIETLRAIKKVATLLSSFATDDLAKAEVVHTHFKPHGTASGRLSSSEPNLQNQPEAVRYLYVPRNPDWTLLEVDYSGIEARLTAFLADDQERLTRYLTIPNYSEHKAACEVFFGIPYCLAPETRVLTSDAAWKSAGQVRVGEELLGFDETVLQHSPKLRRAIVVAAEKIEAIRYRVVTTKGTITCTGDHKWVNRSSRRKTWNDPKLATPVDGWIKTSDLRVGDAISYLLDPWVEDVSREAGWMAGFLDGEGHCSTSNTGFAQKENAARQRALAYCANQGLSLCHSGIHSVVKGEALPGLRLLGITRPSRLLPRNYKIWEGKRLWGQHSQTAEVVSVEYLGIGPACAIQTTTKTLIAEGFPTHNSEVIKDNDKDAPYGKAKRIVHGSNYGLGARKLALMYDLNESEVKSLITKWKAAIQKTTAWQERTAKEAETVGWLTTPFGRKRWFWTDSVYTESLSFLPQSTAADIIFRAMIGLVFDRISLSVERAQKVCGVVGPLPRPATLLLQVHDSLLFELPKPMLDECAAVINEVMTQGWRELSGFRIPIDIKHGESWGEMKSYKFPQLTPVGRLDRKQ